MLSRRGNRGTQNVGVETRRRDSARLVHRARRLCRDPSGAPEPARGARDPGHRGRSEHGSRRRRLAERLRVQRLGDVRFARVTHGLREDLDVRADVAVGAVVVDSAYLRHRITPFGTARLGIERNLVEGIFSLVAGVGGGGTRAGGFVAADAGFVVGYENRYASPFVGAVLHVGVPVTSKTLSIVHQDDATTVRTETRRAYASFGFVASAGVRVPFGGHRSGEPHRHALQLSVDFGGSYGDDPAIDLDELDGIAFVGGTLAYRSLFGTRL